MCWMLVKPAGKELNLDYMDKAQKHNEDGYGVAWHENGYVNVYKTFDYEIFKGMCVALESKTLVVHLRYATKGKKSYANIHPFDTPSGVMFHNGTMYKSKTIGNESDSRALANLLGECEYNGVKDIMPLIKPYVDDKINRLVFFEDNGEVIIVNEELGITEDGVWYSNDYHLKEDDWCRNGYCKPKEKTKEVIKLGKQELTKVFVYGTLKKGGRNHRLLENSLFLGAAKTKAKWTMIGTGYSFPYVLRRDSEKGNNILGEAYEVDATTLQRLDLLEGVPSHYMKQQTEIVYETGLVEEVTLYVKTYVKNLPEEQKFIAEWEV